MPQMMPLYWCMLMLFSLICYFLVLSINYYMISPEVHLKKKKKYTFMFHKLVTEIQVLDPPFCKKFWPQYELWFDDYKILKKKFKFDINALYKKEKFNFKYLLIK